MHRVFKPIKKNDKLRVAYVYTDGTIVTLFERHTDVGEIEYAKAAPQAIRAVQWSGGRLPENVAQGYGRIVFHDPALLMAALELPNANLYVCMNNNSKALEQAGFVCDTVGFRSSLGSFSVHSLPRLISSAAVPQPEIAPFKYDDYTTRFGDTHIAEWIKPKLQEVKVEVA